MGRVRSGRRSPEVRRWVPTEDEEESIVGSSRPFLCFFFSLLQRHGACGAVEKFLAAAVAQSFADQFGEYSWHHRVECHDKKFLSTPMFQWSNYDLVTFSGRHRNRWALGTPIVIVTPVPNIILVARSEPLSTRKSLRRCSPSLLHTSQEPRRCKVSGRGGQCCGIPKRRPQRPTCTRSKCESVVIYDVSFLHDASPC
jgi:hypothetical protein